MIFAPDMLAKVLSGEKTVTRRLHGRISRIEGQTVAVQPGRGESAVAHIRILSVRSDRLTSVTPDEARKEGFASLDAFHDRWLELHGPNSWKGRADRIEFRLIRDVALVCPYCEETTVADEEGVFVEGDLFDCDSCGEELSLLDFPTYVKASA